MIVGKNISKEQLRKVLKKAKAAAKSKKDRIPVVINSSDPDFKCKLRIMSETIK